MRHSRNLVRHAVVLLGFLGSTPNLLSAQEPSNPAALSLQELLDTKVYSASKYEQKVAEAPSPIVVITAEDIQTYGYRTLMDVLATLPGFYVQGHNTYTSLGVRGFSPPRRRQRQNSPAGQWSHSQQQHR